MATLKRIFTQRKCWFAEFDDGAQWEFNSLADMQQYGPSDQDEVSKRLLIAAVSKDATEKTIVAVAGKALDVSTVTVTSTLTAVK